MLTLAGQVRQPTEIAIGPRSGSFSCSGAQKERLSSVEEAVVFRIVVSTSHIVRQSFMCAMMRKLISFKRNVEAVGS